MHAYWPLRQPLAPRESDLWARRAAPLALPLAVGAIYTLTPALGFDVSVSASWLLLVAFACLSTGLLAPRSRRYVGFASVAGCLASVIAGLAWFTAFDPNLLFGLILCFGSWALGVALRDALDRNRRLGAEAEHARIERSLAAARAAASERERISGELHDALAHALGAMVVQASVASDLVRRDAEAAAAALGAVAQAGRHALGETGRLLRLLRDDRDELGLRLATTPTERNDRATPAAAVSPAPKVRPTDLLLPGLFGVIGTVEIAWEGYAPLWASLGAYWLAVGLLCARRALPLTMPIAISGIFVAAGLIGGKTDEPAATIPLLALAFVAAGLHVTRSRAAAGFASVLAAVVLLSVGSAASGEFADVVLDVAFVLPWAVGVALGETLERARSLAAVGEVERSGRTALRDMGRLLRLIQVDADDVRMHPQHGVADLPALADEYVRAGLGIDLEVDGIVARLPMGVELSPGSPVRVRLARQGPDVAIEVRNGPAASMAFAVVPGGRGLVGMRERVSLFGGVLAAGPTPDGGFVLAATLPVDEQTL